MKKLLNLGVSRSLHYYQVPYVKNSNILSLTLLALAFFLIILFYLHSPENIGIAIAFLFPPAITMLLNSMQITVLSRVLLAVLPFFVFSLLIALVKTPGQPSETQFLVAQFALFLLPWALFDIREKIPAIVSVGLLVILFFCLPMFNLMYDGSGGLPFFTTTVAKVVVFLFAFIALLAVVIDIHLKNRNAEKNLDLTLQELKNKEIELEEQEKKLQNTFDEISDAHQEDDKRNWIAKGINTLNNLLRNSNDKNLYQTVITSIVRYLGINQGGIYEMGENNYSEVCFMLKGCYGYDWKKASNTNIIINEAGLLGDAYHEKAPIYTVEVPEDYTYIESGLGKTKPKSIFTVPLIYENNVEGMLELASLKEFQEHEREFILRIANILGRFIESYQVNQQSQELLEKTNQQTEEMRAQEEEMRQNMEELQATQEELSRKEQEYISRINELEQTLGK